MKEIKSYKTEDGQIFQVKGDAEAHEEEIKFLKWYDNHICYGNTNGSRVDGVDMLDWLNDNRDVLLKLLK